VRRRDESTGRDSDGQHSHIRRSSHGAFGPGGFTPEEVRCLDVGTSRQR
jgi:hypothetical protein